MNSKKCLQNEYCIKFRQVMEECVRVFNNVDLPADIKEQKCLAEQEILRKWLNNNYSQLNSCPNCSDRVDELISVLLKPNFKEKENCCNISSKFWDKLVGKKEIEFINIQFSTYILQLAILRSTKKDICPTCIKFSEDFQNEWKIKSEKLQKEQKNETKN